MKFPHIHLGRRAACILVVAAFFCVFELQLFNWQILQGDTFEQEALSHRTDAVEINAARGEILDRRGKILAGNHIVYEVVYNALYMDDSKRNSTILDVVDLLEERGEAWRDILPIELDSEGNYRYKEGEEDEIETLKGPNFLNLADYATADDCMNELAKRYHYEGFSKENTRKVVSVRYSMTQDGFSINDPYVIASGVSPETVGVFGEYANRWKGIETRVGVQRYYGEDGALAPHVVGYTWGISDKQLERAEEDGTAYDSEENIAGYKQSDFIGTAGAESAFEEELRGKRGLQAIFTDENGNVTSTATTIQPEQGHTVQLTLDSELQRVANLSLAKNIRANTGDGKDGAVNCNAGAAVAVDVSDFGVLACSSYPTYDVNRFIEDSDYRVEINNDNEGKPSLNRALQGIYPPGSVFKPMVAIAGLQEEEIGAGATIYNCDGPITGVYELADLELKCTGKHYWANVYEAISGSCNCFFAELGVLLGIRRLDAYAEYFGLGENTGVELYEAKGVMSSPQEYRERHTDLGADWTQGVTAQTAIGQADNMFTPMQLASYAATIANGGQRLSTHFLQQVFDYSGDELIRRYQSQELYNAEISEDVLSVVREAMCLTATEGTARSVFSDYPVRVACKTGTAETSPLRLEDGGTQEHISFICYAPADEPEIAVSVLLEYGHGGPYAMNVAKDILDCYFGFYTWDEEGNRYNQEGDLVDDDGQIVKTKEELEEEAAQRSPTSSPDPGATAQPEGGSSPSENGGSVEPGEAPTPSPSPTPNPDRGSAIPDTIYTGAFSSPTPGEGGESGGENEDGSPGEEGESGTTPKPPGDGTPYYSGGSGNAVQKKEGASPEPTAEPSA
ncbi:penicillin-binding protein [Acutalibacter sp. 1XD8-33]|uniref:penicillin-binding transpeptidase domain-containing protein n=1 Tax=Acutalibacter sp. 1XD8-33 TaxID=2320081 RepID=UPI000EA2F6A3|nr:penicillin-binding transpeptidase domain-containing protein [Acutalibacter sp. 1XD8-33]RKJ40266.1 penicillin-binding protein [Acutalibacter sp. 1XD8-33]